VKARRLPDGTVQIDATIDEARIMLAVFEREAEDQDARALQLHEEARDRRRLAERVKRGRHANLRIAGELNAEAARHADRRDIALDMWRTLLPHARVSASDPSPNPQPTLPGQIE
jgi:hypothetical protein